MIVQLVDPSGSPRYLGHVDNEKAQRLIGEGWQIVDTPLPEGGPFIWDGAAWVPDPTPPVDPVTTPLTAVDTERLFLQAGVTQAQIDAAKRARP